MQEEMSMEYVQMQQSYETLKSPLSRMIYGEWNFYSYLKFFFVDKFGEITCTKCRSKRDFLESSFFSIIRFYIVNLFFTSMFYLLGVAKYGTFWRCTGLLFLCAMELSVILNDFDFFQTLLYWRTYQSISFFLKLCIGHTKKWYFYIKSIQFSQSPPPKLDRFYSHGQNQGLYLKISTHLTT